MCLGRTGRWEVFIQHMKELKFQGLKTNQFEGIDIMALLQLCK